MLTEIEKKEASTYGSISYFYEIQRDLLSEPKVVCPYDQRKACDSMYITKYNNLKKSYLKLLDELDKTKAELYTVRQLLICYQEILNNTVDEVSGKVVK